MRPQRLQANQRPDLLLTNSPFLMTTVRRAAACWTGCLQRPALLEEAGGSAAAVQADVSKVGDVKRLFDACFDRFGRLDILVNNAGVMFTKPVVEVGKEEFDRLFAVSVKGSFFCCQEAAKRMAEGGRIINLSSSTSAIMLPGYAAYVATKGAIEQFSHVLAKELGLEKKFPVGPGSAKKLGYNGTEIDAMPISMEKAFCGAGRLLGLGDRTMANPTPSRYNRPVMTNNPT